ncbi:MAG: ImpA family type VI secretion system protein, partial [Desulfuromonadaceae bacterium]
EAPNLKPISDVVKLVQSLLPSAGQGSNSVPEFEGTNESPVREDRSNGPVRSREDAVRAIDMVCDYLERTEPSNPAQFLLRRASKMINHNFLQLVKELAPDALSEVARIMGVNPDDVEVKN